MNKNWAIFIFVISVSSQVYSQTKPAKVPAQSNLNSIKRKPAAVDPDTPIEVHGQSRNLNMLLILKNENDAIDFIKLRKNYLEETKNLNY